MSDHKFWLGFSLVSGIGPRRLTNLLNYFGDLSAAWRASDAQLHQAGLESGVRANLLHLRATLDLERELERVQSSGAQMVTLGDNDYPAPLKTVPDPPILLYIRGVLLPSDQNALAVVGTRKPTHYGLEAANKLSGALAKQGTTIISGLAHGIDTAAHQGALAANGRTIAVLGTGIDQVYPADNRKLAQEIVANGALISEFPLGTPPEGRNFPRRNRIISGMALGVLVVEAPENSGALITADMAAEQGRDVFAVPGNIFNVASRGANRLIQEGAKLVTSAADILDELSIAYTRVEARTITETVAPANGAEASILALLSSDPLHVDDLARASNLPIAEITSTLTILELKGLARKVGPMQYCLIAAH
ncbi:MAG: DNA-protecting protein DprA [Anaerolineaceae bacterium]|nr:DNA-protecting protein DprA [Anaerolineaceae bacterium]